MKPETAKVEQRISFVPAVKVQEDGHGIEVAFYASDGERYWPLMECLCGWETGRCESWQSAGELLDEHLKDGAIAAVVRGSVPVTQSPSHLSDGGVND